MIGRDDGSGERLREETGSGASRGPQLRDDHLWAILEQCFKHGILGDGCPDGKMKEKRQKDVYEDVAAAVNQKLPNINEQIRKADKTAVSLKESVTGPQCKRRFKDASAKYREVRSNSLLPLPTYTP